MKRLIPWIPDSMIRLLLVFAIFIIGIVLIRNYVIPSELKETGFHRTSAIERELAKEMQFIGSIICADCHEDESQLKKTGYHRDLSCELCHGYAAHHVEDPEEYSPSAPRERKFCPLCHTYNPSRPTGFPQINPVAHNPLEPCISCHDPHDPVPSEVPHECVACHEQITRTKAVSPHVLLDCSTCHDASENHNIQPRLYRPTKPVTREFCGQCHGQNSQIVGTPKIDQQTHGEKYLCWQCHYPHMPEVKS